MFQGRVLSPINESEGNVEGFNSPKYFAVMGKCANGKNNWNRPKRKKFDRFESLEIARTKPRQVPEIFSKIFAIEILEVQLKPTRSGE